ncbi:MAG: adenylate/guanylate cyclase domain-containing protein [Acholeplasma sp.]|nr:adenylate/guanylate cyclase domain-containing protein [Acholeplasma sp.]
MNRSELNALKNELKQIYDRKIEVKNQSGFLDKSQIPSGKKVYNIETSLMFIDIRSSTILTDEIGRKNMVKIYQMYTKLCKKAINDENGIILQIVGDGILCAFSNDSTGNSGQRAVDAAITINTYITQSMNPLLKSDWKISCGIGIRTGHVYVTRLTTDNGSEVAYPSDITNYASKFCGLAQKDQVIIDAKTYEHLNDDYKKSFERFNTSLPNTYIIKGATWKVQ